MDPRHAGDMNRVAGAFVVVSVIVVIWAVADAYGFGPRRLAAALPGTGA